MSMALQRLASLAASQAELGGGQRDEDLYAYVSGLGAADVEELEELANPSLREEHEALQAALSEKLLGKLIGELVGEIEELAKARSTS